MSARLLISVLAAGSAFGEQWPMYLRDLAHSSFNSAEAQINSANVSQLRQRWKTSVHSTIASGVTVVNGYVYFGAWDGNFYALNASDGSLVWKRFVGTAPAPDDPTCLPPIGPSAQATVVGDVIYAGGGDAAVYALDRATGNVLWRAGLGNAPEGAYLWSSIVYSKGALYVGIASLGDCPMVQGGLARIDVNKPIPPMVHWLVPTGEWGAGIWSTPAVDEAANLVYVTTGNGGQDAGNGYWGSALLAMDATTLEIKSYFFAPVPANSDMDWGSSPTLFQKPDGTPMIVANGKDGVMYALQLPNLTPDWTLKIATGCVEPQAGCGSLSTPAFTGRTLFSGAGHSDAVDEPSGSVYAVSPQDGSVLWFQPTDGVVMAPVTATRGLVFAATTNGLLAFDAASGKPLWNDAQHGEMYGQPAVVDGTVYAPYANGDLVAWAIPNTPAWQAQLVATPAALSFNYTQGGALPKAESLNLASTAFALDFSVSADAQWLSASIATGTTPASLIVSADVGGLAPGTYTATVTVKSAGSSNGVVRIPITLAINAAAPQVSSVVNAASNMPGSLAPGALIGILGSNLAAAEAPAPAMPWPTALAGTSVTINGVAAPLSYVSPGQINAQIPYEVAPGPASLAIKSNGVTGNPLPITVSPAAPGIVAASAGILAAPGDTITVYGSGLGAMSSPVFTGAPAPQWPLSQTVLPTTATVGGEAATVLFSGLTPMSVGLAQVNLQVPADLPDGDYPLVITVGDASSNAVTVSVSSPQDQPQARRHPR